jgi:homogentisate 1,2-dioxygenase
MPHYLRVGVVPRRKHTCHRSPDGRLLSEEMIGAEGFASDSSLLYHLHPPTALLDVADWQPPDGTLHANAPCRPRHLRPSDLPNSDGPDDAVRGRRLLLGNDDVRILWAEPTMPSPLHRDAAGDECVFVASGRARVETVFGAITAGPGDYVVLPATTTHRWVPLAGDDELRLLIIEARGHILPPARYLSARGQFLEGAPYTERDLRTPTEPLLADGREVEVYLRHRAGGAIHVLERHPFDVTGWDGTYYPYALNILDFQPLVGPILQPPSTYQTFQGDGFVVCSFVPHPVEWGQDAIPVPYNHANVDYDEVLFYADGTFGSRGSRSGVGRYSMSVHPPGFTHGPHPGAVDAALQAVRDGTRFVQEIAVMIDTQRPLALGEAGLASDRPEYATSWSSR